MAKSFSKGPPQIAFTNLKLGTWCICGEFWSHSGLEEKWPMPDVNCPVVEWSYVDNAKLNSVLRKAGIGNPSAAVDIPALVEKLIELGCELWEKSENNEGTIHVQHSLFPV